MSIITANIKLTSIDFI